MREFSRNVYQDLIASTDSQKITLIFGARQVGKTFLLKKIHSRFKESQYYNLELPEHNRLFNGSAEEIFNFIRESGDLIFIDEFHYIENISSVFKALYDWGDMHPRSKIKIFASGSSAIEMHKHLKESMAGRFKKFFIGPLSFDEFQSNKKINHSLEEFLCYGGLPGVYDLDENPTNKDKQNYLKQLLQTYIQKDIKSLIKEENITAFNSLIFKLAENQGQIVSIASLARDVRVSENIVERYIELLKQTFALYQIQSFSGNLSNELKKSKKYYFYDLGIRNAILGDFRLLSKRSDKGKIWESFVYHFLLSIRNEANTEIMFWRTGDKAEVDFIWVKDRVPYPIEVKSKLKRPELTNSIKTFLKAYRNASFAIILNEDLNEIIDFNGTTIHFISFSQINLLDDLLND